MNGVSFQYEIGWLIVKDVCDHYHQHHQHHNHHHVNYNFHKLTKLLTTTNSFLSQTQDQVTVFSGGCDNTIRMWNVTQGSSGSTIIGRHDSSVKCIKYLPDKNVVVTGSWDKTVKNESDKR